MSKKKKKTQAKVASNPTNPKAQPGTQNSAVNRMMAQFMDAFSNPPARLGHGTPNLMEGTQYVRDNEINWDFTTLNVLYRENWVVKRLINTIPHDMLKNWYKINSQMDPSSTKALRRVERITGTRQKLLTGLKWGRLYGGAAAIMVIDGHGDILDEPLDFDMIMPDSYKGLMVFDRWSGIYPELELVTDTDSPDFGLPEFYRITHKAMGQGVRVHHSRILRFIGTDLPPLDEQAESYWGSSVVESVIKEIEKYDNTSYNIAMLVFKACLRIYAIKDFDDLAAMDNEAVNDLYQMLMMMNWMMSNQGLQIINSEDRFETQQFSFAGLKDVMETFMLDISGAAEIPVTKLFGRSPAGLNSTGESDLQNYYDSLDEKKETELRPILDRLLPVMCMSTFGAVPDDLEYDFISSRVPSEEERKNMALNSTQAVIAAYNAGAISQQTALKELRELGDLTGMWTNITDEDIAHADTGRYNPALSLDVSKHKSRLEGGGNGLEPQ